MIDSMKNKAPGLFAALFCGSAGWALSSYLPGGKVLLALVFGFILGQIFKVPEKLGPGLKFSEKQLLSLAVVFMGAGLDGKQLLALGITPALIICLSILVSIVASFFLGRALNLSQSFSLLIGVGNGICGSSAIAGAAPVLNAREEEVGTSVAVVNLLGTIGMFFIPVLAGLSLFSHQELAYLAGSTLQAVGHVTGAGFAISESVGELAVTVKLGRVFMLAPVLLILSFFMKSSSEQKLSVPYFIPGFILFMLLTSFGVLPVHLIAYFKLTTKVLLCIAMAAIGWKIQWSELKKGGTKALLLGVLLSVFQASTVLAILYLVRTG